MLPILNIGPLAIQTAGLILLAGLWMGLSLAEKKYPKFAVQPAAVNNLVFIGLVAMLIGGRIAFAMANLSAFIKSPGSLISLNPSLWDLPGGVLIGLTVSAGYAYRHNVPFWSLLDALTPGLAVLLIAAGLANLASGNAYGAPAHLPWSIYLWGDWRHPSQVYETLAAALILFLKVLFPLSRNTRKPESVPAGLFFLEFGAWSAAALVFLGAFRADETLIAGQLRAVQVGAWIILSACLFLLGRRKKQAAAQVGS